MFCKRYFPNYVLVSRNFPPEVFIFYVLDVKHSNVYEWRGRKSKKCDMLCDVCREFNRLLDAYVDAASRGGSIRPAPGQNIRDDLLNNDQRFITAFLPTDSAINRITTAYELERYKALWQGMDPHLLQKVTDDVIGVGPVM